MNFNIVENKSKLFVMHNSWPYDLSPSPIVKFNLPPNVMGLDEVLREGMIIKNIKGNFFIDVDREWFIKCDINAELKKEELGGWIYSIKPESLKITNQDVWLCPYFKIFFKEPPKNIYLSIRA
jgi:hypothetical protein